MKHRTCCCAAPYVALLTTLGWPGDSEAQNKIPRVGILYILKFAEDSPNGPFFFGMLRDRGWIEGRTVRPLTGNFRSSTG